MGNDYVRRDGQWGGNPVLVPRDLQRFDVAQFESLNADDGGTWNPSTPIILGGAGVTLSGSNAHLINGGVRTSYGGRLELGHNDWPKLTATRAVNLPLDLPQMPLSQRLDVEASLDPSGTRIAANTGALLQWAIPKRYLHHGATLATADLTFHVGQQHKAIPSGLPTFVLGRLPVGHASSTVLGAAVTLPTPASAAAYYLNGAAQTFTFTATTANVIDVGTYTYILEVVDEGSTGALPGNVYCTLRLNFTSITDMRFE